MADVNHPDGGRAQPERWHRLDGDACYDAVLTECKGAIEYNRDRRSVALEFGSLFEGIQLTSFGASGYQLAGHLLKFKELEVPIVRNTCRSIVRTALSKIAALDNPLPQFMTTGGDWAQRIKNIKLDHMVEAELDQPQGMFDSTHELQRHGVNIAMAATGSYAVFAWAPPNSTGVRAMLSDTLAMRCEYSGAHGRLISLVDNWYFAAADLCEMFPEQEDAIYGNEVPGESTQAGEFSAMDGTELHPDRCVPVHVGMMPSTPKTMGRMVMVLPDGTMLMDKDLKQKECVAIWHYERALYGHWGVPLTRTIFNQCIRIQEIIRDVDKAEQNSPQGIVVYPKPVADSDGTTSKPKGWHLWPVDSMAEAPQITAVPKYAQQSVELLMFHESGAYTASGVSEANVAAKKSSGSSSGKHEHLIQAVFTERFADQERSLTRHRAVTTARLFVHALRDLAERDPKFRRVWQPKDSELDPEEISAKDLDLDAEKYITSIAAVTEEKDSPKDRAEKAYTDLEMGLITPEVYQGLLMHFDSQALDESVTAQGNWIDQQIGRWLHASDEQLRDRNFYQSPSKWMEFESAKSQVATQWMVARSKGAPRGRLAYFERFLSELEVYEKRSMPPPAPPMPMMGAPMAPPAPMAPMGQPMAPQQPTLPI